VPSLNIPHTHTHTLHSSWVVMSSFFLEIALHIGLDIGCGSSVLMDIPMEPEIRYTAVLRECAMLLQMPKGVPVATVAIGNAANAGLLALRILATFQQVTIGCKLQAAMMLRGPVY